MLNFASLFSQFRSQSNSGLSDLLEQPSIKMGRLLEQDSFLNEYKSGNAKVMDFMQYERFQELVELVTVVGPADDKKRSYKYPLSACDILSIDNNAVVDFFFPARPLTLDQKVTEDVEVDVQIQVEDVQEDAQLEQVSESAKVEDAPQVEEASAEASAEPAKEGEAGEAVPEIKEAEEPKPAAIPEKKFKKIIKKEIKTIERVVKKEVEPLIGKLMSYFDGEVNYTLAGYVCKILSMLSTKKLAEFLRYILEPNVCEKVLNHAESRSVGELITKILVNETTICLEQRRDFFKSILDRLSTNSQIFIMSNLSAYVCEIIQKIAANLKGNNKIVEFNNVFFSLDVVTQVIRNVMSEDENVSVYNAPILFTYLTNVPFVLPDDESVVEDFKTLLETFVDKSLEKLQVDARSRPKLGTGRLKIVEILRYIVKENILNTKDIVSKKDNFFPTLIKLMKEYQLNNLLHNEVIKIIETALTEPEASSLNASVLKDNILNTFIIEEAAQDKKIKAGESTYRFRKGYISHIINLALKLKELAEKNASIKKSIDTTEIANVFETFIDKEVFNNKKSLAGFSMRKDIKHEIMFQKDEILAAYTAFLQKCPSPVYEKAEEEEPINIEHPDLVQELQKQLEENLTIKNKEETQEMVIEQSQDTSKPHPEHPITEAEVLNEPNYWVVHIEYNIDDLLVDL